MSNCWGSVGIGLERGPGVEDWTMDFLLCDLIAVFAQPRAASNRNGRFPPLSTFRPYRPFCSGKGQGQDCLDLLSDDGTRIRKLPWRPMDREGTCTAGFDPDFAVARYVFI
jgi:hypothetical protein